MILFDRKEQIMYPFVGSSCTKKTNTNSCGTCYKSSGGCGYLRVTKALLSRDAWVCIGYLQSKQLFRRTGRMLRFFSFFYDSLEILFHVTSISQETSIECDDRCSISPSLTRYISPSVSQGIKLLWLRARARSERGDYCYQ